MSEKPKCAVRGSIRPGAMCSRILVGRELCGFAGECEHQIPALRVPGIVDCGKCAATPCVGHCKRSLQAQGIAPAEGGAA